MAGNWGFGRAIVQGLRSGWARDPEGRATVTETLRECPGRAEGRVADWSIDRLVGALRRDGRRAMRFHVMGACELAADERQIMGLLQALAEGRVQEAELKAQWLVRGAGVAHFLERCQPLADIANRYDISKVEAELAAPNSLTGTAD